MRSKHIPSVDEIRQVGDAYSQSNLLLTEFVQYFGRKLQIAGKMLKNGDPAGCMLQCEVVLYADWDMVFDDRALRDALDAVRNLAPTTWGVGIVDQMVAGLWEHARSLHEIEAKEWWDQAEEEATSNYRHDD